MSDQPRRHGPSDEELGMDRRISRRDFFDGASAAAAAGIAAVALSGCGAPGERSWSASPRTPVPAEHGADYPPGMEGLRGNTQQALSIPHTIRDGRLGSVVNTSSVSDTGEHYDLVVVGAGISGLAAAYFHRKKNPGAKVLILDNHDEFGGHARRNEFHAEGRDQVLIGYGGTQAIDTPSIYSDTAMGLLKELGIEVDKFEKFFDQEFYDKWNLADEGDTVFFRAEEFGRDHLAVRGKGVSVREWLKDAPLSPEALDEIVMLYDEPKDWLPGLSDGEKKERLARMTYTGYLRDIAGVGDETLAYVETLTSDEWAVPASTWGALDAWGEGYPGFDGLGLDDSQASPLNSFSMRRFWDFEDPYIYHFPDGNASIARLLVHALIPGSVPGEEKLDMESVVLAEFDYSKLDMDDSDVRLRLQAPCTDLRHDGSPSSAERVFATYYRDGGLHRVSADHVVMAAWHVMGKYLMSELPSSQRNAMQDASKQPLLYANVVVRNWQPWVELGMRHIRLTGGDWAVAQLDYPVSMGGYEHPQNPDEPIVIQMIGAPSAGVQSLKQGAITGRHRTLKRDFSSFERSIRHTLNRALGDGGFDAKRDIEAITVNRWGHGYAREYTSLWDSFWPDGPTPAEHARKRLGRIVIANSDAAPNAYTDIAIDEAHRAVEELGEA
ncbi:NAD(P)-binding protein [Nocardiopsis sp. RSe5-2]|uniref:NAD(P)-binding protein n=1 Tax=Nocardiopsis endophytica TaxID=3018445 RepID=A0ABT4UCB5_9ACTN|nr:NAD(P)-binding protein [Nocardiopsis endophytica]MDA2814629.1 NAD(P)-binding protein [Nocardiopsis endophytica]